MSKEAIDYLSSCPSLSNILSFLNYDEVVRCMQVNNSIKNDINRNWSRMERKNIYLNVESHEIEKDIEYIDKIIFGENDRRNALHEVTIHNRLWEYSCYPRIPLFLRELLEQNAVPRTRNNSRFGSHFEMKPEIDGLDLLMTALLPRVNITKMNIELLKMDLRYFSAGRVCPLADMDTSTMEISVEQWYYPHSNFDNIRFTGLLEEWKSGKRNVKRLWLTGIMFLDDLCDEMRVTSKNRTTPDGLSHVFFQLERSLDHSLLDISYYADTFTLYVEQLFNNDTSPTFEIVFNAPYYDNHIYDIKNINSFARHIGWAINTTYVKRLCVDPGRGVLTVVSCDAFAFGQQDTNNDRISSKPVPPTAPPSRMVRCKNLLIEYNPCKPVMFP